MKSITHPWFSFAGVRNTDLGILMTSQPTIQHPVIQGEQKEIVGKNGKLFISKGSYGTITVKQDIVIPDASKLPNALKWLNGSGKLIFWNSPNYAYDAMVITSPSRSAVAKRLEGQKMSITWTCQPFREEINEAPISVTSSGQTIAGRGDADAEPLIKVSGTGTVTIDVNGYKMNLALTDGTPLYIDCDAGIAYTMSSSGDMVFAGNLVVLDTEFPKLKCTPLLGTSQNKIIYSGTVSSLVIYPHWRYF